MVIFAAPFQKVRSSEVQGSHGDAEHDFTQLPSFLGTLLGTVTLT